jgi:2-polyprenyl-3-methyl-5-hydroxy-6-metoxy-1,4-benzoquinol methylase
VRQSQATPDGESVFTYVKVMDELLTRSQQILVLGCGGGNLATRLSRLGKRLTIVDINPISFVLAHKFFDPQFAVIRASDVTQFDVRSSRNSEHTSPSIWCVGQPAWLGIAKKGWLAK